MIKILFFIENLSSGGAEKVLRTLVNHMDQSRFDISVMTVWPEDAEKYLKQGIHYKSLYARKNGFNRLRYRAEAALNLAYPLHIRGDYDIEVAYLECGPTKIMAGSTNRKAKKLAWVHCDLKKKQADPEAFARASQDWYKTYNKIVCVSENVKDSFIELFGNDPEVTVVYNTVDDDEIREKAKAAVSVEKCGFTIVSVGRLCEQKAYDRLLYAHKRLIDEGYAHDLWILGDGPDRMKLEQFIADYGISSSVKLLGFHDNPYPVVQMADLLVCSSRYEGFSTFVTEGLILGKPVVTTDCTGMRELLGNSEYGLITENSTDGIYLGLKRLLDDQDLLSHYKIRSRERGESFRKDKLVQQTENFFMELLGAK